mmetsp:Transcript_3241/g.12411  ORF Transcript_3241/g.12411 Transcript_3241/m.12411 type:complete len:239 (-) Transcript_3241:382-1098(-)
MARPHKRRRLLDTNSQVRCFRRDRHLQNWTVRSTVGSSIGPSYTRAGKGVSVTTAPRSSHARTNAARAPYARPLAGSATKARPCDGLRSTAHVAARASMARESAYRTSAATTTSGRPTRRVQWGGSASVEAALDDSKKSPTTATSAPASSGAAATRSPLTAAVEHATWSASGSLSTRNVVLAPRVAATRPTMPSPQPNSTTRRPAIASCSSSMRCSASWVAELHTSPQLGSGSVAAWP